MITTRIITLGYAITIAEGYLPGVNSLTYRNHNPGALRTSPFAIGTRDNFAYFVNDSVGLTALYWDLAMKCHGRTRTNLTSQSTIEDLIQVYTGEKDTRKLGNYISIVERITNKSRYTKLKYFTY